MADAGWWDQLAAKEEALKQHLRGDDKVEDDNKDDKDEDPEDDDDLASDEGGVHLRGDDTHLSVSEVKPDGWMFVQVDYCYGGSPREVKAFLRLPPHVAEKGIVGMHFSCMVGLPSPQPALIGRHCQTV